MAAAQEFVEREEPPRNDTGGFKHLYLIVRRGIDFETLTNAVNLFLLDGKNRRANGIHVVGAGRSLLTKLEAKHLLHRQVKEIVSLCEKRLKESASIRFEFY